MAAENVDPALLESPAAGNSPSAPKGAPRTAVPAHAIVCIEHPCIIKNIDKGLKSLGGSPNIERFLDVDSERVLTRHDGSIYTKNASKTIAASLRPDDPLAKPVMSRQADTNNVLLKITVPRRTGRKRKRGSNGPFLTEDELAREHIGSPRPLPAAAANPYPQCLLRALRDNPASYSFKALGIVNEAHRFRSLPDMQYAASADPFMAHMKDTLLTRKYTKLKEFRFDARPNVRVDIGPPAVFCQVDMPFNYSYQQNALVKFTKDLNGKTVAVNTNKPFRVIMHHLPVDAPEVPAGPHPDIIPEKKLKPSHKKMIARLRKLMETRPILTRRFIVNSLDVTSQDDLRQSFQYCGYHFVTGPWKECLIKFGIDPRLDPQYRIYQSLSFQSKFKPRDQNQDEWVDQRTIQASYALSGEKSKTSHIFNGTTVIPDGKVWQICDIVDPQLRHVIENANILPRCDVHVDGWFRNGTTAKLRGIMKTKLEIMRKGEVPDPKRFERALAFPDEYTRMGIDRTIYDGGPPYSAEESHLLAVIRTMARESFKGTRRKHGMNQRGLDALDRRMAEIDEEDRGDDLEEDEDQDEIEEEARREVEKDRREEEDMDEDDSFFEDEEEEEEDADADEDEGD